MLVAVIYREIILRSILFSSTASHMGKCDKNTTVFIVKYVILDKNSLSLISDKIVIEYIY